MEDALDRYIAPGCTLCRKGAKLVLFVTGRCDRDCWYCPLSAERKGVDQVFANDREVATDDNLLAEARAMSALGTGVTGGDPLLEPGRVVRFCRVLKAAFGPDHHVHLYTGRAPTRDALLPLVELAGQSDPLQMHDRLSDARYLWSGDSHYVRLDPRVMPAHVLRPRRRLRTEHDFDYFG